MAVKALSVSCHTQYSSYVPFKYFTDHSGKAPLRLFCHNALLNQTCIESEDFHV
jgi:hypothetical protein